MTTGEQMDALGAFSYLSNNAPTWIGQLSDLANHTAAKHAEYANAYKRHAAQRIRRRRNSSICSIRTDDLNSTLSNTESPTLSSGPAAREGTAITTPNTSQNQPNSNPRKRGADEAPSVDSSDGDIFVSTRHNLIIEYDGHTQKTLEEMVRNIGTARNNIRKGKLAQLRTPGYRSAMLSRGPRMSPITASLASPISTEDDLLASIRNARRQAPPAPRAPAASQASPFDDAEKQLEVVHGLCETAAYHFLRAGDCAAELSTVKQKLQSLLDLATREVHRLKAEQPHGAEMPEKKVPTPEPLPAPTKTTTDGGHSVTKMDTIEVDDGSDSVESIDLTVFRSSRIRR
ncbi:hypothetical protein BO86DRAFT_389729 [Aspergillus japonicus CBS 114.51]|uniref:Uncharacterized protein n=2 Tax=Aspergillus TaxID=5052 RepID=A0A2V5HDM7_ASPV1|nr:hypothetical protein BO86DRAFT_389729 [Aspergillus japonicus CBS 114.51]PYI20522.1 hypothetical protein BO99DRAFT_401889 [Aspergillus violaceofuscus CBS 115571]RAH81265.1 hypothetical protein BO86DRAFT_389729 [Aspergillus japonicus CBS 114.51]